MAELGRSKAEEVGRSTTRTDMANIEPSTAEDWTEVAKTNDVARKLSLTSAFLEQTLKRERVSCVVFGGSGMGKNYLVAKALADHAPKDKKGNALFIDSKANTPVSLLTAFHEAQRHEDGSKRKRVLPVVFNEARTQFATTAQLNILKIATDTDKDLSKLWHDFTWWTEEEDCDESGSEKIRRVKHKGVELNCPVIAMTNMQLSELPGPDLDAVRSRVRPIEIPTDRYLLWEYTVHLALTTDLLLKDSHGQTIPLNVRSEMIDWFTRNMMRLSQVSIRTMLNVKDTFVVQKPELRRDDLDLLLAPQSQWGHGHPPQLQDWSKLRRELTRTQPSGKRLHAPRGAV